MKATYDELNRTVGKTVKRIVIRKESYSETLLEGQLDGRGGSGKIGETNKTIFVFTDDSQVEVW